MLPFAFNNWEMRTEAQRPARLSLGGGSGVLTQGGHTWQLYKAVLPQAWQEKLSLPLSPLSCLWPALVAPF